MAEVATNVAVIPVSDEMIAFLGSGEVSHDDWPAEAVALVIDVSGMREPPTFRFFDDAAGMRPAEGAGLPRLVLVVARAACERLRGCTLQMEDGRAYLLTADLRAIAFSIRDCALSEAAALPYRLAKCIELLCEIIESDRRSALVPVLGSGSCTLAAADRARIAQAKGLIDERWNEQLTLEEIARHCGINRSKLSRGFREIYGTSVSDALSERRLEQARRSLLGTDLPVGIIGYRSGYQNNASFTRAFGRRFGVSPTELRSGIAH